MAFISRQVYLVSLTLLLNKLIKIQKQLQAF